MIARRLRQAARFGLELPQNLLGAAHLAAQLALRGVRGLERDRGRLFVELAGDGGVSLGHFVFWSTRDNPHVPVGAENRDHEYGHSVQSSRLGPLYLPLVGVPSVARVAYAVGYRTLTGRRWGGYYAGWPERQADVLGGVDPSLRPDP